MTIECNLWLGETRGVMIAGVPGQEPTLKQQGELSGPEHAAAHFIMEVVRCLTLDKSIDHTFNPFHKQTQPPPAKTEKYIKCIWQKSGNLIMLGELEEGQKRWKHANTVEEAVESKRVFTCTRATYAAMPKRRPKRKKQQCD